MTKMAHILSTNLSNALNIENNQFINVIQEALNIQTHADLFHWLQGDLQTYLPHEILLAIWRLRESETLQIDVISPLREMRTSNVVGADMLPLRQDLLARWEKGGHQLFDVRNEDGFVLDHSKQDTPDPVSMNFRRMRSALVHGIQNVRERDEIMYLVFSEALSIPRSAHHYFKLLLPYIDTALRQLPPLRDQASTAAFAGPVSDFGLTSREREIMEWVRAGKTNEVIGVILDISRFTVKNHLKRIFRKLDVSNRAQAVNKIYECAATAPGSGCQDRQ
ncbi:XrtB/PEP-CTERM-associated transcriptional regulator EpsA [Allohahella sp. A8]|uniref:XrtB/PEP-CTERM-associated transcriptional regulator EpsA n=1 Tax=Allohahella sp. A8 TaxID=3141461 RepID=UPI000C09342F|nr:helix-turn-helix transcriptional regulator [Hahellaceae bacterium]|tara:strand:- start:133896 stop:134729 length:834 start_codon:yes stop_codon:yes gene_type:complete